MKVVPITERLPKGGMSAEEREQAIEGITELLQQIESGELDGVVWCATGSDSVYQGHAGAGNDFYRLIGAMQGLQQYLLAVFHVDYLRDDD